VPLPRTPEAATAPLSTQASDTFPAHAYLVTETRSGRRLAYPSRSTQSSSQLTTHMALAKVSVCAIKEVLCSLNL
jgi:hypothetical protein